MKKKGSIKPVSGGRTIVQELEYAQNGTYQRYAGYQVLNIQPSDVFTAAEFDWKQVAVAVTWNGLEIDVQNTGAGAGHRPAWKAASRTPRRPWPEQPVVDLYSNGTADGGLQVGGLQLLVADAPPRAWSAASTAVAMAVLAQPVCYSGVEQRRRARSRPRPSRAT